MPLLPKYIKTEEIKAKVMPILQDYQKLRYITIFGIGVIGLLGIGTYIYSKMKKLEVELVNETRRQELIYSINTMEGKLIAYKKKLNKNGDLNWWIEYILNGSREYNIKITEYQPYDPKTLDSKPGGYKGYLLRFQVEGDYIDYLKFVNWIESNQWGIRISRLRIQKERGGGKIVGNMTIAVLTIRTLKKTGEKDVKAVEKMGAIKVLDAEEMNEIDETEKQNMKKGEIKKIDETGEMKENEKEKIKNSSQGEENQPSPKSTPDVNDKTNVDLKEPTTNEEKTDDEKDETD